MREAKQLTALGEEMEKRRLARGAYSLSKFLVAERLVPQTWNVLLYGCPEGRRPPRDATVIRYTRAVGIPQAEALELSRQSFGTLDGTDEMTGLGAALERCRLATGEDTMPFLASRGLHRSTWYRLLHERHEDHYSGTIARYAAAAGLDVAEAQRLAEQDRRSRPYRRAANTASGESSP